ncbi:nSTAND1 domain-containing NTPase [Undibacterium terreum]|uniref:Novel STAND NTPase 1 domain-containing protein n=1 Tax=Undibacterium terreum TaxID=1224302 RepID=A0A916UAU4_9BURK|nr:hypothetical protein [Undibacterium terreum]GGC65447.1 hypothetical protein GCM10011396_10550 [Undibacterium terreum]
MSDYSAPQIVPTRPYLGLDFFHAEDAALFTERDREISDCSSMLLRLNVKIFVLQGSTGAGKSSFLRAGLIPRLREWHSGGTYFLSGGDCVIRCTSDPLARIAAALAAGIRSDHLELEDLLPRCTDLDAAPEMSRMKLAETVLSVLQQVCQRLSGHLILILDQAEEVLTQAKDRSGLDEPAQAFFYFLEEVYLRNIDVRIIVGLRTEYYGRFRDELGIDDDRISTRPHSGGVEPYLLRPIRNHDALKRIILAPSKFGGGKVFNYVVDEDVAEKIVNDLLAFFAHGSITPFLQVICAMLYERMSPQTRRITLNDYKVLGDIHGIAFSYLDRGIMQALGQGASQKQKDRWLLVLHSLASTQGGGMVVSNTASISTLKRKAEEEGIHGDIEQGLGKLCGGSDPLLIGLPVEAPTQFSLKHDVLAVVLKRWEVEYITRRAGRTKAARRYGTASAVFALSCVAAVLYHNQNAKYQTLQQLVDKQIAYAQKPLRSDFGQSLYLALSSLDSIEKCPFGRSCTSLKDKALNELRSAILRSPLLSREASTAGFDTTGRQILLLSKDGSSATKITLGAELHTETLRAEEMSSPAGSTPKLESVNFAASTSAGGGSSVLIGDKFFHWDAQGKADPSLALDKYVKKNNGNPYAQYAMRGNNLEIMNFQLDNGEVKIEVRKLLGLAPGWNGEEDKFDLTHNDIMVPPPLSSDSANSRATYAYLSRVKTGTGDSYNWNIRLPQRQEAIRLPDTVGANTTRLGFVSGDNAVLVQCASGGFDYISLPALGNMNTTALPRACRGVDSDLTRVQVQFGKDAGPNEKRVPRSAYTSYMHSPLAAARSGNQLSLAWITEDGVAVASGQFGTALANPAAGSGIDRGSDVLLSGEPNGSTLQFSDDGTILVLLQQPFIYAPVRLRIWDLSKERIAWVNHLEAEKLIELACSMVTDLKTYLPDSDQSQAYALMSVTNEKPKCLSSEKNSRGKK